MNTIKFSNEYPKLWNQTQAKLIDVSSIYPEEIKEDLIEYDTKSVNGKYYELPKTKMIQLTFIGEKRIPFCTIRRWTADKEVYYSGAVGEIFEIVRTWESTKPSSLTERKSNE